MRLILLFFIIILIFIINKCKIDKFTGNIILNVINLDKSKDRLEYFKLMCNKLNIKYNRIRGIDGRKHILTKYEKNFFKNVNYDINKKKGIIGCHLSHIKALETLKNNDFAIICEDDIDIIEPNYINIIEEILKKININENYLIYLSGYSSDKSKKPKKSTMKLNDKYSLYDGKEWYGQGNMMYLITKTCMNNLLNKNKNSECKTAVDYFFIRNSNNTLIIYPPLTNHRKDHKSNLNENNL